MWLLAPASVLAASPPLATSPPALPLEPLGECLSRHPARQRIAHCRLLFHSTFLGLARLGRSYE
jgi:hypothetical protein